MNREEKTLIEKIEGNKFLTTADRQTLIDSWKALYQRLEACAPQDGNLKTVIQNREKQLEGLEAALRERDLYLERK